MSWRLRPAFPIRYLMTMCCCRGIGREKPARGCVEGARLDRKSTRLNSSHTVISYAVFCLKKKKEPVGAGDPRCRQHANRLPQWSRRGTPCLERLAVVQYCQIYETQNNSKHRW